MTTNAKITEAARDAVQAYHRASLDCLLNTTDEEIDAGINRAHALLCQAFANHAAAAVAEREALIVKLRAENERLSKAALSQVTRELLAEDENSALLEFVKTLRGDHLKDTTPHAG